MSLARKASHRAQRVKMATTRGWLGVQGWEVYQLLLQQAHQVVQRLSSCSPEHKDKLHS